MWQEELAKILREDLELRKGKNSRYSRRAYAKYLGISPAALSAVLKGSSTWSLKKQRAAQVLSKTSVASHKKKKLLIMMGLPTAVEREPMPSDNYSVLTDWRHMAVLLAHRLPPHLRSIDQLQKRFGLSAREAGEIILALRSKNLLQPTKESAETLEALPLTWVAESGPPANIIRGHHRENLKLAIRSIEEISPEERDLSSVTFCGSIEDLKEIRKEIRSFHEKIINLMDKSEKNDEVIHLSISLFPMKFPSQEETK